MGIESASQNKEEIPETLAENVEPPVTQQDAPVDDPADKPAPTLAEKAIDWTFLKSTRFYAIVLIAVTGYLEAKGYIGQSEMVMIWTIAGGFGIVKTVDRTVDKVSKE